MNVVIRRLVQQDYDLILTVINEAAQAYRGIIPEDRWKDPYMPAEELREEIDADVQFYGWFEENTLLGVMGIQPVHDTTLIRHAYVLSPHQGRGIGGRLLHHVMGLVHTPEILVGTWQAVSWAIRFYEEHGFTAVSSNERKQLLRRYWEIPERQVETSVVLRFRR